MVVKNIGLWYDFIEDDELHSPLWETQRLYFLKLVKQKHDFYLEE